MTAPAATSLQPSSSSTAARWQLAPAAAFPLLAILLFAFFVAGSAPSPLFVVFQQQWGFSPALLTVAFAIYAIALLTGIAVKFALHPVPLVFGVLAAICVTGAVATLFLPESVTPRPGALASLVPRISVPVQARAEFVRGVPTMLAVWSLAGLYL